MVIFLVTIIDHHLLTLCIFININEITNFLLNHGSLLVSYIEYMMVLAMFIKFRLIVLYVYKIQQIMDM